MHSCSCKPTCSFIATSLYRVKGNSYNSTINAMTFSRTATFRMATSPPFRSSSKNLKPAETFFTTLDRKDLVWMNTGRSGRQGDPATGDPRSIPAIDRTRGCAEHSCATEEHSFFLVTSGFEPRARHNF